VVVALANRIAVIDGDAEVTSNDDRVTVRYTRLDARSRGLLAHLVDAHGKGKIAACPRHLVPLGAPVGDPISARDEPELATCTAEPLVAPASVPRLPEMTAAPKPARGVAVPSGPLTAPPPLRSKPLTAPPLLRSKPLTAPPPLRSKPLTAPPPLRSKPLTAPPPLRSKPLTAPPPSPGAPPPSLAPRSSAASPAPAAPVMPAEAAPGKPRRRRETQPTLLGVGTLRRPVEPEHDPVTDESGRPAAGGRVRSVIEATYHGAAPMRVFEVTTTDATPAPYDGAMTAPMTAPYHVSNIPHELDTGETEATNVGDDLATDVAYALPELPSGDDLDPLVDPPTLSSMPRAGLSRSVSGSSAQPRVVPGAPTAPMPLPVASAPALGAPTAPLASAPALGAPTAPLASAPPPAAPPLAAAPPPPAAPTPRLPSVQVSFDDGVEITEFIPSAPRPPSRPSAGESAPRYGLPASAAAPHPHSSTPGGLGAPLFTPQPLAPPLAHAPPTWTPPAPSYAPPAYQAPSQQYPTAQLRALDYDPPARATPASSSSAWQRHRPEMPEDVGDQTEIVSVQHLVRRRRWPVIAITSAIVVAIVVIALAVSSQSDEPVASPPDAKEAAVAPDKPAPAPAAAPASAAAPAAAAPASAAAPAAAAPASAAAPAAAAPASAAAPAAASAAAPAADEPAPAAAAAPAAATDACKVAFSSSPDGAELVVAGQVAGVTPVTLELPCQASVVSFRRDRYQTVTKHFTPTPGDSAVAATLARPSFTVTVTSTPRGAKILVGGVAAGSTPGTIDVPGFEGTPVEVVKPGFAPHQERVYPTKPGTRLDVRLRRK